MRATLVHGRNGYVAEQSDLVIQTTFLFGMTIYPLTKEAEAVINSLGLDWEKRVLFPRVGFSLRLMTVKEMIKLLKDKVKDIEIIRVVRSPV